jgi:glycosyltransferase involved in cell wall biosynthesis
VVGFVGRNQPCKQIPTLIKAVARFAKDKPDAFLYLHTAPVDAGWDLPELIDRLWAVPEVSPRARPRGFTF